MKPAKLVSIRTGGDTELAWRDALLETALVAAERVQRGRPTKSVFSSWSGCAM